MARRCNILIVEDDDHLADVVTACLQRDHVIYRAKDGGEAVGEKFAEIELDVTFVDQGLTDLSGDKVAVELQRIHAPLAPVLITGWHLQDDDTRLQAFDHHLRKSFTLDDVRQAISLVSA